MELKKKLLELNIVEDNTYLDRYIKLILDNKETKNCRFKTQKHHIIPKAYYKYNKLPVDNSKDNIVNLLYKDHILAHYYLYLCAKGLRYKKSFSTAFLYLYSAKYSNIPNTNVIKLDDFNIELDKLQEIYEENSKLKSIIQKGKNKGIKKGPMSLETRLKLSESHKGKTPWNKGKKFPNSYTEERRIKQKKNSSDRIAINRNDVELHIPKEDLEEYIKNGWKIGKSESNMIKIISINTSEKRRNKISLKLQGHKISENTRNKISSTLRGKSYGHSTKGQCWVNNGTQEKLVFKNDLYNFLDSNKEYKKGRLTKPFRRK